MKNFTKAFMLVGGFMLSCFFARAQSFSIKRSDHLFGDSYLLSSIPIGTNSASLFNTKKANMVLLDSNMRLVKEMDLIGEEKNTNIFDLVSSNNKSFFIYTTKKKSVFSLHVKEIDDKTFEIKTEKRGITDIDEQDGDDYLYFRTLRSADSSKFIFYCDHREYGGKTARGINLRSEKIQFAVLDKDMNRLYHKEYIFPFKAISMSIRDYFVSNDGSLYILYFFYPDGNNLKKTTKSNEVPYEVRLLKLSEKDNKEFNIPNNGLFFQTVSAFQQPNGILNVVGLYKHNFKDAVAGSYRSKFSPEEKSVKLTTYPFTKAINDHIPANAYFENTNTAMELKYKASKIVSTGNQVYMFHQYLHTPSVGLGKTLTEIYDDIILTSFSDDGITNYTTITMPQDMGSVLARSNSNIFLHNSNLYFFYSDEKGVVKGENKKQRGFWLRSMDLEGKILSTKMVADYTSPDDYEISDRKMAKYGNDFFTVSFNKGIKVKTNLCKITIQE